jgi:hypothetical protein
VVFGRRSRPSSDVKSLADFELFFFSLFGLRYFLHDSLGTAVDLAHHLDVAVAQEVQVDFLVVIFFPFQVRSHRLQKLSVASYLFGELFHMHASFDVSI